MTMREGDKSKIYLLPGDLIVYCGDTIDLVISCGTNTVYGRYQFPRETRCHITVLDSNGCLGTFYYDHTDPDSRSGVKRVKRIQRSDQIHGGTNERT